MPLFHRHAEEQGKRACSRRAAHAPCLSERLFRHARQLAYRRHRMRRSICAHECVSVRHCSVTQDDYAADARAVIAACPPPAPHSFFALASRARHAPAEHAPVHIMRYFVATCPQVTPVGLSPPRHTRLRYAAAPRRLWRCSKTRMLLYAAALLVTPRHARHIYGFFVSRHHAPPSVVAFTRCVALFMRHARIRA